MNFEDLLTALNASGYPFVAHGWNAEPELPVWGVLALDAGGAAQWAGDRQTDQAVAVSIDAWARSDVGSVFEAVQAVLRESGLPWRFVDGVYDSGRRALHFAWVAVLLEVWPDGNA